MKKLIRTVILPIVVLAALFSVSSLAELEKTAYANRHVYLLIGQSNMAGRAEVSESETLPVERLYLLNADDKWEPASHPLNQYSTIRKGIEMQKLNPGYGFAMAMLSADPEIEIGLVVNARGGTKIEQWEKGTDYHAEAVRRTKAARKTGILKGILWHQGEGNSSNPDPYSEKLSKLIKDLRQDLDDPNLPFVAGQVFHDPLSKPQTAAINALLEALPEKIPYTGCVLSSGLTAFDNTHFDTAAMKELGRRYAEIMLRIQSDWKMSLVNIDSTGNGFAGYPVHMNNETLLRALELDKAGDWDGAHRIAQDIHTADGSWVHAYLHRKEGDLGNAAYWYSRAGKPVAEDSLGEEWERLRAAFGGD